MNCPESFAADSSALFEASKLGSRDAFSELIRRNCAKLHSLALGILKNEDDARDVIQNATVLAFSKLSQCRDAGSFSAWLGRIAFNQAISRLREMRRFEQFKTTSDSACYSYSEDLVCQANTPEEELGRSQVSAVVRAELKHIPHHLRHVLILNSMHDMTVAQIGCQLGLDPAVVKSRLFRARRLMRARLQRHLGRVGPASFARADSVTRAMNGRVRQAGC